MAARLGADIGGTFTDVVLEAGGRIHSAKVLTTHAAPEDGIVAGMARVCADAGIAPSGIGQVIHGTTLATNALIERRGARTALVTTEGFRDVIEMRTESRFEQYDLNLTLPEPLLPREARFTVAERVDADGGVLVAPDVAEVEAVADRIARAGYASVAVGFMHSYLTPDHERLVRDVLARRLPDVPVSLSCEVSPQMREYERFNTTVANAYIQPLIGSYLGRLEARLAEEGMRGRVFLMHSGGGIVSVADAATFPVRLVESGPAGGAVFAAHVAARHGLDRVLSFDMGGTTAKICLIRDGAPKTARVFEVARSYRFKKGSGMPISIPVIDMVEIGAGGGSLAWLDAMGRVRVGPQSAGSEPGPACYGLGGTRPAVTDADLVLGRIDPEGFAGGAIALDPAASRRALVADLGEGLGTDAEGAAHAVSEMVDETMANAARVHAVEAGEDLSGYTMIAFGGAAPLHAGRLCEKLGIARALVPPGAGVGSAVGFLRAPFSFEATRSAVTRLSAFDGAAAGAVLDALRAEATAFVRSCDAAADVACLARAHMRYVGQGWEIPVALEDGVPRAEAVMAAFEAEYARLFGRVVAGLDVEVTVWSVTATTPAPPVERVAPVADGATVGPGATRRMFDPARAAFGAAGVVARGDLDVGARVAGPAAVVEAETTVVVPGSMEVAMRADGSLEMVARSDGA